MGISDLLQIQGRRTRRVGIAIAAHVLGFRGFLQRRKQLRTAPPVADTGTFEVGDDHRRLRVAADAERFFHRLQHRFEFTAQVGGVHRAECRQFFSQLLHFVGGGVEGAGVGQACG